MESQIRITDLYVNYANQPLARVLGSANHGGYFTHVYFIHKVFSNKMLVHTA